MKMNVNSTSQNCLIFLQTLHNGMRTSSIIINSCSYSQVKIITQTGCLLNQQKWPPANQWHKSSKTLWNVGSVQKNSRSPEPCHVFTLSAKNVWRNIAMERNRLCAPFVSNQQQCLQVGCMVSCTFYGEYTTSHH